MEKREKVLQQAKELLESANLTVNDLVQYCAEKKMAKKEAPVREFAFEVMYEGLERSWIPLEGKKPLGVIFENHLITLKDSPDEVSWYKAMDYCQSVKIDGHFCSAGSIKFWEKLLKTSQEQKEALDNLLISLGGAGLKEEWRWSSSELSSSYAWVFCTYGGAGWGGVNYRSKGNYGVVRPVLDLTDLSLSREGLLYDLWRLLRRRGRLL